MRLKISSGNSKLGKIPNLSLPPGVTCRSNANCYTEGCYAVKFYRMYKGTKKAWDSNWEFYKEDPYEFFKELQTWLLLNKPSRFRFHVSGDFPDEFYLRSVFETASICHETKFLAFTKRYESDFSDAPPNLQIILSVWSSMPVPENPRRLPEAWLEEDPRRPLDGVYFRCQGNCIDCAYACWDRVSSKVPVFFPKH